MQTPKRSTGKFFDFLPEGFNGQLKFLLYLHDHFKQTGGIGIRRLLLHSRTEEGKALASQIGAASGNEMSHPGRQDEVGGVNRLPEALYVGRIFLDKDFYEVLEQLGGIISGDTYEHVYLFGVQD